MDNNVAFSTIGLRIVQKDQTLQTANGEKNKGFGNQLSDTLSGSKIVVLEAIKLLIIVLVGALPVLAVGVVLFIPIRMVVKRRNIRGKPLGIRS